MSQVSSLNYAFLCTWWENAENQEFAKKYSDITKHSKLQLDVGKLHKLVTLMLASSKIVKNSSHKKALANFKSKETITNIDKLEMLATNIKVNPGKPLSPGEQKILEDHLCKLIKILSIQIKIEWDFIQEILSSISEEREFKR